MRYVNVPQKITSDSLKKRGFSFAPSRYSAFYPDDPKRYEVLSKLVKLRNERKKIQLDRKYIYIEIGDINVNTGSINYIEYLGKLLPNTSPLTIKQNDVLISTVRTYRKGIGFVDLDKPEMICTPAMAVIAETSERVTKEYIFAILRTDFFIEQILSFQNRGMYPRLDKDTINFVHIPLPRSSKELEYISLLQKVAINKEREIREKSEKIDDIIGTEIGGSTDHSFVYSFPLVGDLREVGRLDTGPYTSSYKTIESKIKNYKSGSSSLDELGYTIGRGQNLQISNIGISVYSESKIDSFYRLLLSKYFTDWMTVENYEYIGNPKKLKTINKGDIIFSCRGDLGRIFISCEQMTDTITNIDNVHIRNEEATLENKIFIGAFLNYLRKVDYLSQISVGGSGADSFTKYHFDMIKIPNFSGVLQKKIANLYYNTDITISKSPSVSGSDVFIKNNSAWNEVAGISQLDSSAKSVRTTLVRAIDNIIYNKQQNFEIEFY